VIAWIFLRALLSVFVPLLFVLGPLKFSNWAFLAVQTRIYKLLIYSRLFFLNQVVKVSY